MKLLIWPGNKKKLKKTERLKLKGMHSPEKLYVESAAVHLNEECSIRKMKAMLSGVVEIILKVRITVVLKLLRMNL